MTASRKVFTRRSILSGKQKEAEFTTDRVEPPFWWVGMKDPMLQVLVYKKDIGNCSATVNYPGVVVKAVHKVQNPNYLFIDLMVGAGTQAGVFDIALDCEGVEINIPYELKQRAEQINRIQGVDASDLIYLIMPDRFANGDTHNDRIDGMQQSGTDRSNVFFRHGGDLIGIMEHLDYLEALGVTALWLNPVLENDQPYESYHGYAITDHYKIDPRFGSNEQYLKLIALCHERGIKMIMDIVHNHVGDQHWFIHDLPEENWIHQPDTLVKTTYRAPTLMDPYAAEADRFRMLDGWFDNHMPDLNQQNPFVANYLIQNHIWWTEYSGHDGFRIDTYAYNDQQFMAKWGQRMQAEFPSLSIFGETWVHGTPIQAQFTQNNHLREGWNSYLPGVTDYQMYYAIKEALLQEQGWTSGIARIYYTLAKDFLYENPYQNILFLDNHDLSRIFSVLNGDMDQFRSGIALLMTLRGIPMLYYGTEILIGGTGGAFGEGGRQDFPGGWKGDAVNKFKKQGRTDQEQAAFEYIQVLANYRKQTPALQHGQLTQFVPEDGVYVFFRFDSSKTIMTIFNSNNNDVIVPTDRYQERILGFAKGKDVIIGNIYKDITKLKIEANSTLILELIP